MDDDIYVGRHGQDKDNAAKLLNGRRDTPLTELGVKQIHQLADNIEKVGLVFDAVWVSPLRRALKSAGILCQRLKIGNLVIERDLIEREFGPQMTGQPIADIEKLCPPEDILKTATMTYFLRAPGSEDYPSTCVRAQRVLAKARRTRRERPLLFIAHSDIGKMLYACHYGLSWQRALEAFHFGNSELLRLSDCSISEAHVFKAEQHNF